MDGVQQLWPDKTDSFADDEPLPPLQEDPQCQDKGGVGPLNKTQQSQNLKGSQSYYYWHNGVAKGENAAPKPTPQLLSSSKIATTDVPVVNITTYSFLDDDNVVKVYIPLEGPLANLSPDAIECEFSSHSLLVTLRPSGAHHRLWVEKLAHEVDPPRCKSKVVKQKKLVKRAMRHQKRCRVFHKCFYTGVCTTREILEASQHMTLSQHQKLRGSTCKIMQEPPSHLIRSARDIQT